MSKILWDRLCKEEPEELCDFYPFEVESSGNGIGYWKYYSIATLSLLSSAGLFLIAKKYAK